VRTVRFEKNIPQALLIKALRQVWPDVVFSRLSPTQMVNLPDAPLPGPRWVRARNLLCGVCASDLHLLNVEADPRVAPAVLPGSARMYLGHEAVAVVTEVGAGVKRLQVGDRVVLDVPAANCLSQEIDPPCRHCRRGDYFLCENESLGQGPPSVGGGWGDELLVHETQLYRPPEALTDEAAVLFEPFSVAVRAALRRLPEPGERALVVGSGTMGLMVIAALRALAPEARITAMARYPTQQAMARQLGADEVWSNEEPYAATSQRTGAQHYRGMFGQQMLLGGFDVVFDCVGSARTLRDSLRLARAGGAVVLTGIHFAPLSVDMTPVWYQEVDLLGLYAHGIEVWQGEPISTYDLAARLLLEGALDADGFITHRFPLERWQEAVRAAKNKRNGAIKVVLDYR
jgi:threonine dehydrogenase-like Zn-dependent dehydrogenase